MTLIEAFKKDEKYVFVTSSYAILLHSTTMKSANSRISAPMLSFGGNFFDKKGQVNDKIASGI